MGIYMGTLNRFDYDLTVISTSEDKARELLKKEYVKAYMAINHHHPAKCHSYCDDMSDLDVALDEMCIEAVTLDKVEWR